MTALDPAAGASAAEDGFYSIQVRAVPMAEKTDGMATYRALRDKGYLVYFYRAKVKGKRWLRIAVGAFDTTEEAAAFGDAFSDKEGMEHFVARAPVRVIATGNGRAFVVTPSALWTRQGDRAREVFVFADPPPQGFEAPGRIGLTPSPDGTAAFFLYGKELYAADFDSDAAKLLAGRTVIENLEGYRPRPRWSPSGRFVAFLDIVEWEYQNTLWVAVADGSALRPLVATRKPGSKHSLQGFIWHPSEDRILFVRIYAWGATLSGGDVYSIDMAGNTKKVVGRTNMKQTLSGPLWIEDGYLYYLKLQFDEDYNNPVTTKERVPLSDL